MIVFLDRRKVLMMIIAMFSFSAILCTSMNITKKSVLTSSTPVSSKIVVLDAGHGKPDEGAQSKNGVTEEKTNLLIVLKLQKLLEESGCTVILTRSDENGIYDLDKTTLREKKVSDVTKRVKLGNESSADIFVSVHLNKGESEKYNGWQTFYREADEKGIRLAKCIQNGLRETINVENKRTENKIDGIYIVDNVEIPITIVECGFLSNPQEEKKLLTDEYQNELAWGIYTGILNYFSEGN